MEIQRATRSNSQSNTRSNYQTIVNNIVSGSEKRVGINHSSTHEHSIKSISFKNYTLPYTAFKVKEQGITHSHRNLFAITFQANRCKYKDTVLCTYLEIVHQSAPLTVYKHTEDRLLATGKLHTVYAQRFVITVAHHKSGCR